MSVQLFGSSQLYGQHCLASQFPLLLIYDKFYGNEEDLNCIFTNLINETSTCSLLVNNHVSFVTDSQLLVPIRNKAWNFLIVILNMKHICWWYILIYKQHLLALHGTWKEGRFSLRKTSFDRPLKARFMWKSWLCIESKTFIQHLTRASKPS